MISRILEFVRDMLIARIVDVDLATDAFFVAFKMPNFFGAYLQKALLHMPLFPSCRIIKKMSISR